MVFVLGDHGMTSHGDHGGDSEDEVTAGLFVYSTQPFIPNVLTDNPSTIHQVPITQFNNTNFL